jgi:SAM-dependent methyltransferase
MMKQANRECRFCGTTLQHTFVDLGMSPISNANIKPENSQDMEPFYPLHAYVCDSCYLVQLEKFQSPGEIFSDYAYFSSYSQSWLQHAKDYVEHMMETVGYDASSQVVELASNDGYLLRNFRDLGVPVLGIEPAQNVADVAREEGIPTITKFFGVQTARELVADGVTADLLIGNNVLAHVPDLNDFVAGMKIILKPDGIITMEFPHLAQLMAHNQFDTIYHEHFSYFSFYAVEKVFAHHGLTLFNVTELPTHGGSLRIYARHADDDSKPVTANVENLRGRELQNGINQLASYQPFAERVKEVKRKLLEFLIQATREGKSIAAYGAAAKGNTLLNYCGIRTDFIDYAVDASPHKQGLLLPGTHIPVYAPDKIAETKPDYLLILPWNLKDEIMKQTDYIRDWGGQFVVPIPEVAVY